MDFPLPPMSTRGTDEDKPFAAFCVAWWNDGNSDTCPVCAEFGCYEKATYNSKGHILHRKDCYHNPGRGGKHGAGTGRPRKRHLAEQQQESVTELEIQLVKKMKECETLQRRVERERDVINALDGDSSDSSSDETGAKEQSGKLQLPFLILALAAAGQACMPVIGFQLPDPVTEEFHAFTANFVLRCFQWAWYARMEMTVDLRQFCIDHNLPEELLRVRCGCLYRILNKCSVFIVTICHRFLSHEESVSVKNLTSVIFNICLFRAWFNHVDAWMQCLRSYAPSRAAGNKLFNYTNFDIKKFVGCALKVQIGKDNRMRGGAYNTGSNASKGQKSVDGVAKKMLAILPKLSELVRVFLAQWSQPATAEVSLVVLRDFQRWFGDFVGYQICLDLRYLGGWFGSMVYDCGPGAVKVSAHLFPSVLPPTLMEKLKKKPKKGEADSVERRKKQGMVNCRPVQQATASLCKHLETMVKENKPCMVLLKSGIAQVGLPDHDSCIFQYWKCERRQVQDRLDFNDLLDYTPRAKENDFYIQSMRLPLFKEIVTKEARNTD